MMTKMPVAGVVWQTAHYLVGLRRLGYEPYYVEAGGHQPSAMLIGPGGDAESPDDRLAAGCAFIDRVMARFDLARNWALHDVYGNRSYGLSDGELSALYRDAELIINLHGGTVPLPEHYATGRLVYLETDPVALQIELYHGEQRTV